MSNGSHFQWTAGAPFNNIRFSLFTLIDFVLFLSIILMNIYSKILAIHQADGCLICLWGSFLGVGKQHHSYTLCVCELCDSAQEDIRNQLHEIFSSALCISISECVFMKRKCSRMYRKKGKCWFSCESSKYRCYIMYAGNNN